MRPSARIHGLALLVAAAPALAHADSTAPSASPPLAVAPVATSSSAGKVLFESRLRYEGVDQDALDDATALTLRARLGWQSPEHSGFRLLVEGEAVVALSDRYNDTINGAARYPVVADPEAFELNRLQVAWTGAPGAEVIAGRQRIVLGSGRFVGNVGFRQNEQTFDALKVTSRAFEPLTVTYAWIDKVHRVFGDDSPAGKWRSDSHLLNIEAPTPAGRLTAYGYLLDFANAPAQSSATLGVRLDGTRSLPADWSALYALEFARQSDYGASPDDFKLDYAQASAGLRRGPVTGTLAVERLGGNGVQAFQTPLATLHAFQGWADVFLNTPREGLRDLSASISYAIARPPVGRDATVTLSLRDFRDDHGSVAYGRELDASARLTLNERWAAEVKTASFDGATVAFADRRKVWAAIEYRF